MNGRTAVRALIAIVAIVVIILILLMTPVGKRILPGASGNKGEWQSVFLSNGQVYFGHITGENSKEVILEEIYYLQVDQQLQPNQNANTNQTPKLSLVKLGNELHGPQDRMRINRDQVTFIEDLKNDGKVVSAINDYKKNGPAPASAPAAPAATPAP